VKHGKITAGSYKGRKSPFHGQGNQRKMPGLLRRRSGGSSGLYNGKLSPLSLQVWEESKSGHKQPGKVLLRGNQIKIAVMNEYPFTTAKGKIPARGFVLVLYLEL